VPAFPGSLIIRPQLLGRCTEETYRNLSAKGRRLTTDGFSAQWSLDGKKLAFSLGVHGYSGVAVFDHATKETDLLIVPGKDPKWSPDGKSIAFVRDCEVLRLEELATVEREDRDRPVRNEEVWIMNADGTEPRRLAGGSWPSWGRDSTHVYYLSRADNTLCLTSVEDRVAQPRQIMKDPGSLPSVSPDNQRVSYFQAGSLKVVDLVSQAAIAQCTVPGVTSVMTNWSGTGNEVCLGGRSAENDKTGLWVYDLPKGELLNVLDGPIVSASRSMGGTHLAFCLGPPYFEIWAADLDPNISTIEALGPGQTSEEYVRGMVASYTHRIQADPLNAYAYSTRARYYDYLHDQTEANADMRRWSAAANGQLPCDLRRVIEMPFDCELVFSAERPVNKIPILSIAFGQKGSREMKVFEIPMFVMSLFGFCLLSSVDTPTAHADFTFGKATNLGPMVNSGYHDYLPCLSPDGVELYFCSDRPGGYGGYDIWVTKRAGAQDPWGPPENAGPQINSAGWDEPGSLSADGLTLYFDVGSTTGVMYTSTRATKDAPWGPRVSFSPTVNMPNYDAILIVSPDELELFFASSRPGGYGQLDIWVTTRATKSDSWGTPMNLGPAVNTYSLDVPVCISPDGLTLFVFSNRPGGFGAFDMWMTTRASKGSAWGPPTNLGPSINTSYSDWITAISPDGQWCYISDYLGPRPGGLGGADIWQAPIIPIVDFNGDKKVDLVDLVMLINDWGKNKSACDIGPMPWGDGKVDIEDLKVFMTYYEKENPAVKP
jgi:Tol biopolymer transport system component